MKTVWEMDLRTRELQKKIANLEARDIHTCHDDCKRAGCVNGRLRAALDIVRKHEESHLEINPDVHRHDRYRENMYHAVVEALSKHSGERGEG